MKKMQHQKTLLLNSDWKRVSVKLKEENDEKMSEMSLHAKIF